MYRRRAADPTITASAGVVSSRDDRRAQWIFAPHSPHSTQRLRRRRGGGRRHARRDGEGVRLPRAPRRAGLARHAAGLTSILDYIVVANGVRLETDDGAFVRMIQECKGQDMRLCVFNTHTLRTRETILRPNDDWGGSGLLGITIRFDVMQQLDKHTLHVLDVYADSPASAAGLDAFNDFVLGVGDLLFDGPDEFGEIVQHNCNRPVRLYVYNARTEEVREVMIARPPLGRRRLPRLRRRLGLPPPAAAVARARHPLQAVAGGEGDRRRRVTGAARDAAGAGEAAKPPPEIPAAPSNAASGLPGRGVTRVRLSSSGSLYLHSLSLQRGAPRAQRVSGRPISLVRPRSSRRARHRSTQR